MNIKKLVQEFDLAWKKIRRIVPFLSLLSCLHKVYSEAPSPDVFVGNSDKNVIAFLRMEVREKINRKNVSAGKNNFNIELVLVRNKG